MTIELAHFSLILIIFLALGIFLISLAGLYQKNPKLMGAAWAGQLVFFILLGFINYTFIRAFIGLDYSVKEVVLGASLNQNWLSRVIASLLSPRGSFLFLMWFMTLISYASIFLLKKLDLFLVTRTYTIYTLLIFMFSAYAVLFANPFIRTINLPEDGIGIDLSLQNALTFFIMLLWYLGAALGAFLFSFTLSALFEKNKQEWQKNSLVIAGADFIVFLTTLTLITLWNYNNIGWKSLWSWHSFETSILMITAALLALILIFYINIAQNCLYKYSTALSLTIFGLILFSLLALKIKIFAQNNFFVYALEPMPLLGLLSLFVILAVVGFWSYRNNFLKETKVIDAFSYQGLAIISAFSLCTMVAILLFASICPVLLRFFNFNLQYLSKDFYNFSLAPFVGIIVFLVFFFNIQKPTLKLKKLFLNEKAVLITAFGWAVLILFANPHSGLIKTLFFVSAVFLCFIALIASVKNIVLKIYSLDCNPKEKKARLLMSIFQIGLSLTVLSGILMASYKKDDTFAVSLNKEFHFENLKIKLEQIEPIKNDQTQKMIFSFDLKNFLNLKQKIKSSWHFDRRLKQVSYQAGVYRGVTNDLKIYVTSFDHKGNVEVHLRSEPFVLWLYVGLVIMILSSSLILKKILLPS